MSQETDLQKKLRETYQGVERRKSQTEGDQRARQGLPRQAPVDYSGRRPATAAEIARALRGG